MNWAILAAMMAMGPIHPKYDKGDVLWFDHAPFRGAYHVEWTMFDPARGTWIYSGMFVPEAGSGCSQFESPGVVMVMDIHWPQIKSRDGNLTVRRE